MLILTRKPGETLRIGDDIAVTILETKGSQVRVVVGPSKGTGTQGGGVRKN